MKWNSSTLLYSTLLFEYRLLRQLFYLISSYSILCLPCFRAPLLFYLDLSIPVFQPDWYLGHENPPPRTATTLETCNEDESDWLIDLIEVEFTSKIQTSIFNSASTHARTHPPSSIHIHTSSTTTTGRLGKSIPRDYPLFFSTIDLSKHIYPIHCFWVRG